MGALGDIDGELAETIQDLMFVFANLLDVDDELFSYCPGSV